MSKRWIVVADSSKARIFNAPVGEKLEELETLTHPDSHLPGAEMKRGRVGMAMDSGSQGRHGLEPSADPKKDEALIFARMVAEVLDKAHSQQKYQQLAIFAAPAFLGLLRDQVHKTVAQAIFLEVPKNIAALSASEIQKHLRTELDK